MDMILAKTALLLGGYLLGAVPFGLLIVRIFYGKDIREHGSRNIGATNVWRSFGKKAGITTLALDAIKGAAPVMVAKHLFPSEPLWAIGAGFAAILGHNWSIFLMGSGGKGVATSAGVFVALVPLQGGVAIATFLIVFLATQRVSVGSIAAAIALLTATLLTPTPVALRALVVAAAGMVLFKHIPNMKRLARGEEPKVNFR